MIRVLVADDQAIVRAGLTDVEQGQAIDVDADLTQHHRQRLRVDPHRLDRRHRRRVIERIEGGARRESGPFGRLHARNAAAFLIDQDRDVVAAGKRA